MELLTLYLIIINVAGFLIMLVDKHNAVHGNRRTPEKVIWTVAAIGGSLGCLLGMRLFRHKTKKGFFPLGIPLLFIAHIFLFCWLYMKI